MQTCPHCSWVCARAGGAGGLGTLASRSGGCHTVVRTAQHLPFPVSPHPAQHLLLSVCHLFLFFTVLVGVTWCPAVVWVCGSWTAEDAEKLRVCVRHLTLLHRNARSALLPGWQSERLSFQCELQECPTCRGSRSLAPLCAPRLPAPGPVPQPDGPWVDGGFLWGRSVPEGCWLRPWFCPAEAGGTPACDSPDCPLGVRVGLGERLWLSSPSAGHAFLTHGSPHTEQVPARVCVNLRSGVQNPMQACSGDLSAENVRGGQCFCGASMSAGGRVFCFSRLPSTAEPQGAGGHAGQAWRGRRTHAAAIRWGRGKGAGERMGWGRASSPAPCATQAPGRA